MKDHYRQIKSELELTKRELEERMNRIDGIDRDEFHSIVKINEREKEFVLDQNICAELEDVNRALLKLDFGVYGYCEETGEQIPIEQLQVLPTIRTLKETAAFNQYPYVSSYYDLTTTY